MTFPTIKQNFFATFTAIALLVSLPTAVRSADYQPAGAPVADQQEVLSTNEHFRQAYADAKAEIRSKLGPVIVLSGDKIMLLNQGERQEAVFVPAKYTLYKTVDHIPLMIFVALRDTTGQPLSEAKIEKLQDFIPLIQSTTQAMSKYHLPLATVARQKEIMDRSLSFLRKVIALKSVSAADLNAFTTGLRKPITGNIYDAVEVELSELNRQVQNWRKQIPADKWKELKVVVAGGHMPRQQSHFMQYFSALLGQKHEGNRLVYMEGLETEEDALNLLITHILDESIGVSFFNDKQRMHRDLLSDGARLFLSRHRLH